MADDGQSRGGLTQPGRGGQPLLPKPGLARLPLRFPLSQPAPGSARLTMTKASEIATLQTAWRTAAERPDGLTIPCPDIATARNLRFRLYNAVKPVRDGGFSGDTALVDAVSGLKVSVQLDPPAVCLNRKAAIDLVSAALAAVGVSSGEIVSAEDGEIAESLRRMQAIADEGAAAEAAKAERVRELFPTGGDQPNPFFIRGSTPGSSS